MVGKYMVLPCLASEHVNGSVGCSFRPSALMGSCLRQYHNIAGNFHGLKLSRINENIIIEFRKKTFADCQSGIWAGPYYMKSCG